jgi:hypothetical protein
MKRLFSYSVLTLAMLFTANAFAKERTITFSRPTTVAGQSLAAGEYKVRYEISGTTAEVRFLKGNKEVASTSAQIMEHDQPAQHNGIVFSENGDGTAKLVEIQFENKKAAISFSGSDVNAGR